MEGLLEEIKNRKISKYHKWKRSRESLVPLAVVDGEPACREKEKKEDERNNA